MAHFKKTVTQDIHGVATKCGRADTSGAKLVANEVDFGPREGNSPWRESRAWKAWTICEVCVKPAHQQRDEMFTERRRKRPSPITRRASRWRADRFRESG
jgi:hypothetical protein